jgi:hypothetical protein
VNRDNQIPVIIRHVLEADITEDTRIIEEDIDPAVGFDGSFDDLLAVGDTIVVGYCFAACGFDFVDNDIGGLRGCPSALSCLQKGRESNRTLVEFPSPLNDPPRSFTTTLAPLEPKKRAYAYRCANQPQVNTILGTRSQSYLAQSTTSTSYNDDLAVKS